MSAKNDLNAIYKLEFYKKKKNWKLKRDPDPVTTKTDDQPQQEVEEDKSSTINNNGLNKTYDIDRKVHTNALLLLNNAFLEIGLELPTNQNNTETEPEQTWVEYVEKNMGDFNHQIVWTKPDLPWDQVTADCTQQISSDSLESLTSFMTGASCAPHSSDTDVTSTDDDLNHIARCLSAQHEESMLRHLLVRATGREPVTSLRCSHHTGPFNNPGASAAHPELILAGSFNLNDVPGKGRGRLRRPGVVAIRVGHAYFNQ